MERLQQVLAGAGDNHILPFLWMHGEPHGVIREELAAIAACGIGAVCVESRPHPDYCGPHWWRDMDVVMEEARARGMRVWVLDDDKFPTGHANGAFEREHPELSKLYLAQRSMDVMGPTKDAAVLIAPFLPEDARLLAVLACPRDDLDSADVRAADAIDVTDTYADGFVRLTLPAGAYRVFVLLTTHTGGGRPHYMNVLDARSVRVQLDAVYEPHYARYAADFGATFAGFFSDEPEFGNTPWYDFQERLGKPDVRQPWSGALEDALRAAWGPAFAKRLPALWYNTGGETSATRFAYMDEATRLMRRCFSEQVGGWCAEHGVEYIGHVLEDDNSHGRLGCGMGHYFREQAGQHFSGIDVVHHQIHPGFTGRVHRWMQWEDDGEFFHFGLAKLGSSAAHIDPKKRGRALCEIFGNYGWGEGIGLMKWLVDHMLVRGINEFVPHAFSPTFPDRDCPPHFYARGNNPQFEAFGALMRYTNRLAHLLSGGAQLVDAAVLYHAEAEWAGAAMLFQKPVRALMERQLGCDVAPADALLDGAARIDGGRLLLGGNAYPALVIPYSERLPAALLRFLMEAARAGLPVLFVDGRPSGTAEGGALPEGFAQAGEVVPLAGLAARVAALSRPQITVAGELPDLRLLAIQQGEDTVCMLFNESVTQAISTKATLHSGGYQAVAWYDAAQNRQEVRALHGRDFDITLAPGEAAVAVLSAPAKSPQAAKVVRHVEPLNTKWRISRVSTIEEIPSYAALPPRNVDAPWTNINQAGPGRSFVGHIHYTATFFAPEYTRAWLRLPRVSDAAHVRLNDADMGWMLGSSGRLELTGLMPNRPNTLHIEVPTTLVWRMKDPVSAFMALQPTGLGATPELIYEAPDERSDTP